mmetsp:Transcript_14261/g.22627  ORF Transcript_14261/g.22627 Transcript_14261/m.22627 type:complete len:93 (+) Transcript_14261:768-1046(+)
MGDILHSISSIRSMGPTDIIRATQATTNTGMGILTINSNSNSKITNTRLPRAKRDTQMDLLVKAPQRTQDIQALKAQLILVQRDSAFDDAAV